MPTASATSGENPQWRWLLPALGLLVFFAGFKGDVVLDDKFHQGEYFAAAVNLLASGGSAALPLTIHGALDFLPALLARAIWGDGYYFIPTEALYRLFSFFAWLLLLGLAAEFSRGRVSRLAFLLAVAVVAPLLVGYRDLLLLLSVYLLALNLRSSGLPVRRWALKAALGISVGLGLFWSYDRGIAGAVSLGVAVLLFAWRDRSYLVALGAFVSSVLLLGMVHDAFTLGHYVQNVLVLVQTSSQWRYGLQSGPVMITAFGVALNLFALAVFLGRGAVANDLRARLPIVVGYTLLALLMLRIGTNRADLQHVYWACWMPMLLANSCPGKATVSGRLVLIAAAMLLLLAVGLGVHLGHQVLAFITAGVVLPSVEGRRWLRVVSGRVLFVGWVSLSVLSVALDGLKSLRDGEYFWLASLQAPPENSASTDDAMRWIADRLRESQADCVFDLSNNGVINGLTGLPSCSRFVYPVYAGKMHETELIKAVQAALPPVIVYSSTYKSYAIDGKTMQERFPRLDEYLRNGYRQEECAYGYCLRRAGSSVTGAAAARPQGPPQSLRMSNSTS